MANILTLIPMKPTLPAALVESALRLLAALQVEERRIGEHQIEAHIEVCAEAGDDRPFSAHAAARNSLLDRHLQPHHTHVLWIDADLVEYPSDLATRLHVLNPAAIVAPFVLIENSDRFYDIYGFVDWEGRRASHAGAYLEGGDLVPMQSVGCCYLAPADVYRPARYAPTPGYTEHYSVCRLAQAWAARRVVVKHADLPKYGERWHIWREP